MSSCAVKKRETVSAGATVAQSTKSSIQRKQFFFAFPESLGVLELGKNVFFDHFQTFQISHLCVSPTFRLRGGDFHFDSRYEIRIRNCTHCQSTDRSVRSKRRCTLAYKEKSCNKEKGKWDLCRGELGEQSPNLAEYLWTSILRSQYIDVSIFRDFFAVRFFPRFLGFSES